MNQESLGGRVQLHTEENDKQTISNYSGSVQLKQGMSKHTICPHHKDYCKPVIKLS